NSRLSDRFEQPQRAESGHISRVFRDIEAHTYVRLGRQVIDLIRLHHSQHLVYGTTVMHVCIHQVQSATNLRGIVDMVYSSAIETTRPSDNAIHVVVLCEK